MSIVYANILDSLTSGLYNQVNLAIREYIQNSYDAIKDAMKSELPEPDNGYHIAVNISKNNKIITISDNGIGMNEKVLREYTSIGGGTKNESDLTGFRGIGKLSGLRFFEKFVVKTKTFNSKKGYELIWNSGEMMKTLISKPEEAKKIPYSDFIKHYFTINETDEEENKHYTQVQLINVNDSEKDQVSVDSIGKFIKGNCPVPFIERFNHADIINEWLGNDLFFVNIFLNDEKKIVQFYDNVYGLVPPIFRNIKYLDKNRAKVWFSWIKDKSEIIENEEIRGIKFRCKGICVGDNKLFIQNCMPPGRGEKANWFTGEVIVLDDNVRPSTARDRFNEGAEAEELYNNIKKVVGKELSLIAEIRNVINVSKQDLDKLKKTKKKGQKLTARDLQKINERIKTLKRYNEKNTPYGFDFGIINELETISKVEEERVIEEVRTLDNEVVVTIEKGNKLDLIDKLINLKEEEANAPTKKTKKEYEKPIQKIVKAILHEENNEYNNIRPANPNITTEAEIDTVVNILISYLDEKGIDHNENEVRNFVMNKIQHA